MKPYELEDPSWIRYQTARIRHRHALAGKHWRLDVDAELSRLSQLRAEVTP